MLESEILAAARQNRIGELRRLIALRANINARDEDDSTPLMLVSSLEATKILLEAGADPLLGNREGWCALDGAIESEDLERQKVLAIASAKKRNLVEIKENDTNEIIVYKLITSLLYESSRHGWEEDPCWTMRRYIACINSAYRGYTKGQFIDFIQEAETRHHTFFGSYISDNSDSEEERAYTAKTPAQKREFEDFANTLRARAQVGELRYQRKSGNHARGDLKLNDFNPSNLFDLSQRIQINRSELDADAALKQQVEQDLAKYNEAFKQCGNDPKAFTEAIAGIQTQFVVAQYRGITYFTTKFNKPGRKAHRDLNEVGKPVYSQSVIQQMGVRSLSELPQKMATTENFDELAEAISKQVKEILVSLRGDRGSSYQGYAFNCLADLMQQAYSTDYHRFHQLIQRDPYLRDLLLNYSNPFVSTGDIPYHAAKYAFGMKPYKGHEWERLRPRWQLDGTAERPYSGKLYISLHPITDYIQAGPNHLVSLVWQGRVQLDNLIVAERESSFLGYIPKERVVGNYKAKYPSFKGPYKQIYLHKYGIDESLYLKFQAAHQANPPHTPQHKVFKKLLGEWLCSYYEVRMINKANHIAKARGQVLVYRDKNGLFSLTPPIDTPTRNGVPEEQKTPVKQQRELRKQVSSPNVAQIDPVEVSHPVHAATEDIPCDEYSTDEEFNRRPDILSEILLNAVRNGLSGALKHFLTKSNIRALITKKYPSLYRLDNATLLHVATGLNYPEIVTLLSAHIDVNTPANESTGQKWHDEYLYLENLTPLLQAVVCNSKETAIELLKNPNVNKNLTACGVYNKDKLDDALITWDDVDIENDEGTIAQFLIKPEIFPIVRIKGWSALHLAVLFATPEILRILVDAGVDQTIKDTDYPRKTAYALALELGRSDHAAILKPNVEEVLVGGMSNLNLGESASNKQRAPSNTAPHAAAFKTVSTPAAAQSPPKLDVNREKVIAEKKMAP